MNIITRNFYKLLRAGAFGEEEQIEPMSAWKWRRVYQYSLMHGVQVLAYEGIKRCSDQFFMQLPGDLSDIWEKNVLESDQQYNDKKAVIAELYQIFSQQQLRPILIRGGQLAQFYEQPDMRTFQNIEFFFPYPTQGAKADKWIRDNTPSAGEEDATTFAYEWKGISIEHHHRLHVLTNKLLNHKLQNIIEKEIRESEPTHVLLNGLHIETISPTLTLLVTLLRISHYLLNNGISLKQLADLGVFLRNAGDKVDFVKLQTWIDQLYMKKIAQLSGALLVELFHFTYEEIPFMTAEKEQDTSEVLQDMFKLQSSHQSEWYFQQGKDIFVHASNSSAMMWHIRHSSKYSSYYPAEGFTNFFASFAHSLTHIEE